MVWHSEHSVSELLLLLDVPPRRPARTQQGSQVTCGARCHGALIEDSAPSPAPSASVVNPENSHTSLHIYTSSYRRPAFERCVCVLPAVAEPGL